MAKCNGCVVEGVRPTKHWKPLTTVVSELELQYLSRLDSSHVFHIFISCALSADFATSYNQMFTFSHLKINLPCFFFMLRCM